jgi:hypothetical protein
MKHIFFCVVFFMSLFSKQTVFAATEKFHSQTNKNIIIKSQPKKMTFLHKLAIKKISKKISAQKISSEDVFYVLIFILGIPLLSLFFIWLGLSVVGAILLALLLVLITVGIYAFVTMNFC